MDNTTVEGSLDDTTILDTYNATPEAASYEITPEKGIELQALQKHRAWLESPVEPTDYSTLSGKQNRTIRDSIDFIVGDNQELYSKPATSKQDYFERGFLDQDGKSTEKGLLAMTLVEKGVLNKDFTVSENGQIFTLKESDFFTDGNEEAQTTYTSYFEADPSRYDKMLEWKRAKEYGLFDEVVDSEKEKSFGETIEEKAKGAGEFFYNTGKTIRSIGRTLIGADALNLMGVPQSEAGETKDKLRAYGAAEGFFENGAYSFLKQAAGVSKLTNAIDEKMGLITKKQADDFNTFNEYKPASLKNFQNKTKTVEALASAAGIDAAADLLASGEQVFGKERSEAIQAEGQQPGEMAGDWVNIELGPIMKLGSMAVGSSSRLLNSVVNAKNIKQVEQITFNSAKSSLYAAEANKSASMARMFGNEVEAAALLEKEAVTFGNTTEAVAHAANKAKYAENAAVATEQAGKYAAESRALRETANVLENTLPPTIQSQLAMAGKVSVATPLKVIGAASKKLGDTLAVVDRGASAMLGVFGMSKFRGLARAAGVFTGYVNPLTIAEGIVASNKIWNGAGRLLNSLGENMLVNQGTTPFFRRVAADMATPVGKTFATVADSFIPPVAKGVGAIAKGVKSAAVPSLIYQTINHQGLDANVLKQAASDAIVFGAPLGVVHIGKSFDFKATRQADRANFNNKMKGDPAQYEIYNSMVDPPTKDVISSFSAAYPNAKVQLVTEGASFQRGNTVVLNVNAPKEIASVVALHELNHFLSNELQASDLIVQQMVGDKTRPGEIFTKNGTLDPEFVKFGNEYNRRMEAMGEKPLGINDMAIEFYTDKAAEVLMRDISSGEFTKRAQESKLSRSVKSHFSTFVNQVPIIKNIHIKMGGAIDYSGRLVAGSGLVSEGITQSAGVQAMVRKMYRDTSGLSRPPRPTAKNGTSTTQPPPTRSTRDGVNNGTAAVENVNKAGRDAGLEVPEGALDPSTPRGMDGVPTPLQTKAIIDSGAIAPDHLGTFPLLVAEMVPDSTATFMFEYFPAEQGRTPQSAAGESFHHVKPAGVKLNKDGKVLIAALDINLWDQNIKRVANSKAAKDLGYSEKDIRADSYEASKFHIKNQSPDAYFEGKYGKDQAARRKSLVAATYGEMTAKQRSTNPLLTEVGMEKADGVYRTFSLDDIKRSTRTNASVELAFDPNNYYSLKANLMPEAPIVDRSGNIIENPMMKDFFENHLPSGQRFRTSENKNFSTPPSESAAQNRYMPEASGAKFKPSKVTARDINEIAKEVGGGKVSGGAKKFGAFMRSMNEKEGGITLRDVVKSYTITQSSIQRGALKNASLRKSWADHPFKEESIRPEDAFAKLLQTKEGKAYLDSAEVGIFNKEAATVMIDKFRSFGLHNTLAKHLEQAVNQFHPKAKELLSAIRDMPTSEFIDYIQKNYKGISYGKTGFFSGNLGRGDIPTFDSRQSKLVYGEVVKNTKKVIMDQTDRLPQLGIKVPNEFKDFTQTLLHHEVWDRLNKTNTEHLDIKETMLRYMPEAVNKIPKSEGGYLKPSTWESLENVGYKPSASEKTQIATTASTYEKIANANAKKGMRVLDFAAGRGNGTASIKEIGKSKGFEVSGYEPYSNPKTRAIAPEYEGMDSLAQIPNNSYDLIINNAVLNVVPESVGRGIARDIYSKLAPEGSAFINVMGWSNIKSRLKNPKTKLVGPREVVTQKGTFQKGYTTETLRALIESELPDAKVVRTNYGDIGFKVTKPPVKIVKEEISMPTGIPNIPSGNKRFLPEPVEKLSAFAGKRVQVLTSDLSIVKNIQHGKYTAKFEGGPGYLDNDGWAFTSKEAADAFATRWRKDGEPLIGLASLGPANHLNSLDARKAYGEKWKSLVDSKVLNEKDVSSHIQEAMARIVESNSKSVKPAWKEVAGKIKNANDLAEYFDKIPWAAAPMFYGKLTAKTLPISHKRLVEHKLDLDSVAKEYRQPEFHESKLGDLYAIAEYDGSVPDYKPELNKAYPWRIKFSKRATLSEMHNVADLTTDPRAFAGKKVGGRLGAQPLMVTGINLDRLMVGDLKASGKPLTMHPETAKTKSDVAKGFGSGNPSGYRPYSSEPSKPIKKSKSTTKIKTSAKSILDVAKMK